MPSSQTQGGGRGQSRGRYPGSMEILHWEFALGVLEVGDVYGGHRGREDDDEGEGGVLGAGLVAQQPELHRLHRLVTHLHDELLRGGLEPDVHQEPDVSAGGDEVLHLPPQAGYAGRHEADLRELEHLLVESLHEPVHLLLRAGLVNEQS